MVEVSFTIVVSPSAIRASSACALGSTISSTRGFTDHDVAKDWGTTPRNPQCATRRWFSGSGSSGKEGISPFLSAASPIRNGYRLVIITGVRRLDQVRNFVIIEV